MKVSALILTAMLAVVIAKPYPEEGRALRRQSSDISEAVVNFYNLPNEEIQVKDCLPLGAACDSMLGPQGTCCGGAYCPPAITDVAYCTAKEPDAPTCIPVGGFCSGFAGPVGTCCCGSSCEYDFPDYAICKIPGDDTSCLGEGETCSGFAGPTGTCCKGLSCVNEPYTADLALCRGKTMLPVDTVEAAA